jgi:hypothetical protein
MRPNALEPSVWGTAHECKADGKIDFGYDETQMDLHNNEVGRTIGRDLTKAKTFSWILCERALADGTLTVLPQARWQG